MKTSEMVLDFLRKQGFCPEVDENGSIIFKYQMCTYLFINNDEDEEFFLPYQVKVYLIKNK